MYGKAGRGRASAPTLLARTGPRRTAERRLEGESSARPGGRGEAVTERRPSGEPFESWVDRQIREAVERGEFDDLPGLGKPIPDIDRPYDEMWWVRRKLEREGVSALPPALALRKEAERAMAEAMRARSETEVRRIVADLNDQIRALMLRPIPGPPLTLVPYDADEVVRRWREKREDGRR